MAGSGGESGALSGAREAVMAFLRDFEACDVAAMDAAFAEDATSFDRQAAGDAAREGHPARYRRAGGLPAGMRELCAELKAGKDGPPYHRVEPRDLLVQGAGDIAVISFHLVDLKGLGRRTVVLARRSGAWKILHLHASNVLRG